MFGKFVIDRYDIHNGLYNGMAEQHLWMERYILENSDGICNRSFIIPFFGREV